MSSCNQAEEYERGTWQDSEENLTYSMSMAPEHALDDIVESGGNQIEVVRVVAKSIVNGRWHVTDNVYSFIGSLCSQELRCQPCKQTTRISGSIETVVCVQIPIELVPKVCVP